MSESIRRKSSSRQLLQNLIRVTAQRSQEDAEELEREQRRRAREKQRGETSPSWPEPPPPHTELTHSEFAQNTELAEELKPSCCLVLDEDEGFSDWSNRLEKSIEHDVTRDCRARVQRPAAQERKLKPEEGREPHEEDEEECEAESNRRPEEASAGRPGKMSSNRKQVRTSYSSTVFLPQDVKLPDRTSYLMAGTMKPRGGACRLDGESEQEQRREEVQAALQRPLRSEKIRPRRGEEGVLSFTQDGKEDLHLSRRVDRHWEEEEEEDEDLHLRRVERQRKEVEDEDLHLRRVEKQREEEEDGDVQFGRVDRHRKEVEDEDLHFRRVEIQRDEVEDEELHFRRVERQKNEEEEEEEHHRLPDKVSSQSSVEGRRRSGEVSRRSTASVCSSSEGEDQSNCYGPMSPTFKKLLIQFYPEEANSRVSTDYKIIERTESLRKSTGSIKKTQPPVPVSKIDKKLEQYTHALEVSSKEGRSGNQVLTDLTSPSEPVMSKRNMFEARETWNQNAVSPSKDADGFKVGVADLINQWVRGGEDGSRCSSPFKPGENSSGKRYKFVVTGHGKYEKVSVEDDCNENANYHSAGQFYEDL